MLWGGGAANVFCRPRVSVAASERCHRRSGAASGNDRPAATAAPSFSAPGRGPPSPRAHLAPGPQPPAPAPELRHFAAPQHPQQGNGGDEK